MRQNTEISSQRHNHENQFVASRFLGSLRILSDDLVMGFPGKLILRFTAGEEGLPKGYRLLVELPKGWSNYTGSSEGGQGLKYQFKEESADGYFKAVNLPERIKIKHKVHPRSDIFDVYHRFSQLLIFEIKGRALVEGESFEIECVHHIVDGQPVLPFTAGSGHLRWSVISPDVKLNKHGLLPYGKPKPKSYPIGNILLSMTSGNPEAILVTIPSVSKIGEKKIIKVRLLDRHYNMVAKWPAAGQITCNTAVQDLPETIFPDDTGLAVATFSPSSQGIIRIRVSMDGVGEGISNPMTVSPIDSVSTSIYWGDIHCHSRMSHDGMGIDPYGYARDVSALDFCSLTDHHISMTDDEWQYILDLNESFLEPGKFVPIVGTEHGTVSPSGHFNLYFSQSRPDFTPLEQMDEIPAKYGDEKPLAINHHTGIMWNLPIPKKWNRVLKYLDNKWGPSVDWSAFPDFHRDAIEIYSLQGQSERYKPGDPLNYEQVYLTLPKELPPIYGENHTGISEDGPCYARDGWASGHVMGTVAGSDDHHSQPGKAGGGLTAVLVNELTRESVFEAIKNRHTYATTGDRIILGFTINGHQMGSVIPMSEKLQVNISAIGTDDIAFLEVMKYDLTSAEWEVVVFIEPEGNDLVYDGVIENHNPAIYYVRLEQEGLSNGRVVRAWSSPIWVGMAEEKPSP